MTATLFGNISFAGILAFVAVMYFTGLIVPRRVYKDMEKQRDTWEAEWRYLREQIDNRVETKIDANTEALRLVQQSFESISSRRAS
jgi:hypothetical protein